MIKVEMSMRKKYIELHPVPPSMHWKYYEYRITTLIVPPMTLTEAQVVILYFRVGVRHPHQHFTFRSVKQELCR